MRKIKAFLDREYWEWQAGDRNKTIREFADYLGVEYGALSSWMGGVRQPRKENVKLLADKLGDEIYAIMGMIPPGGMVYPKTHWLWELLGDEPGTYDAETGRVVEALRTLPQEERSRISRVVFEVLSKEILSAATTSTPSRQPDEQDAGSHSS